jgi:hypothetical protein
VGCDEVCNSGLSFRFVSFRKRDSQSSPSKALQAAWQPTLRKSRRVGHPLLRFVSEKQCERLGHPAMSSLAELKSAAAVETYASHLTDSSRYVRYDALLGMRYVTQAPACSFTDPEKADAAEVACRQWWESTGRQEVRSR